MRLRSGRLYNPPINDREARYMDPRRFRDIPPSEQAYPINVGQSKLPITSFNGTGSVIDFLNRFELLAGAKQWDDDA